MTMSNPKPTSKSRQINLAIIELLSFKHASAPIEGLYAEAGLWGRQLDQRTTGMPDIGFEFAIENLIIHSLKLLPLIPANLERALCRPFSHRFFSTMNDLRAMTAFAAECMEAATAAAKVLGREGHAETIHLLSDQRFEAMEGELDVGTVVDLHLLIAPGWAGGKPIAVLHDARDSPCGGHQAGRDTLH